MAVQFFLAHHEFGRAHRPFLWPDSCRSDADLAGMDYWLEQWRNAYRYLVDAAGSAGDRLLFVGYEWLCAETASSWRRLCARLDLDSAPVAMLIARRSEIPEAHDVALRAEADGIYRRLTELSESALG